MLLTAALQQQLGHVIVEHALLLIVAQGGQHVTAAAAADAARGDDTTHCIGGSCIGTDHRHRVAALPQTVADLDACGAVETRLQIVPYDTEIGQTHPAGFHRARAGHAVAFALLPHLGLYVLQGGRERERRRFISMTLLGCSMEMEMELELLLRLQYLFHLIILPFFSLCFAWLRLARPACHVVAVIKNQ